MINYLTRAAGVFWPEIKEMPLARKLVSAGDVIMSIYGGIITIFTLIWLVFETNISILNDNWIEILFFMALIEIFNRLNFFLIVEIREDRYGSSDGSFSSMMLWASVLIFGMTALWGFILLMVIEFIGEMFGGIDKANKWSAIRGKMLSFPTYLTPFLIANLIFPEFFNQIPISNLSAETILYGCLVIISHFAISVLIYSPYLIYGVWTQKRINPSNSLGPIARFFILALGLPTLAHPFALLIAFLFTVYGPVAFGYLMVGLGIIAYLTRVFSWAVESNRQQSQQLKKLESLGRAIMNSPADASTLPELLEEHIPGMFPSGNVCIWIFPDDILLNYPIDTEFELHQLTDWLEHREEASSFLPFEEIPWNGKPGSHHAVISAPIRMKDDAENLGGIYLELRTLAQPWTKDALEKLYAAIHTLADQIASAIHQAEEYAYSLAYQKVSHELQIAGQIQASFLPWEFPEIPGWQLAVSLEPAGGLSGDFFDLIPLSRGRLGIVVADVADKGLGSALYMALSRTLLRTYALEYHSRPDIVLSETNDRILQDASASLFVTAFYGILDPEAGTLVYCNAGHNPPYLISQDSEEHQALIQTGMPIGIEEESSWRREEIELQPGDVLTFYSDGIPDALNTANEFFGNDRLLSAVSSSRMDSAYRIQTRIMQDVKDFRGDCAQYDDITLLVLKRNLLLEE